MIKYGVADFGMNQWFGGMYSISDRLEKLKELGFQGTERLEVISEADAITKAALYHRLGMDFATCRGPNVAVSTEWSSALSCNYIWLNVGKNNRNTDIDTFIMRAKEFCHIANRYGIRVGIHNHLGQRIQNQDEIELFLEKCPECNLLLDIGHLFCAGGNSSEIIKKYSDRLVAIHVKDANLNDRNATMDNWFEKFKFCALGTGNMNFDIKSVLETIKKVNYSGWIHVEQDTHYVDVYQELEQSFDFLKKYLG